MFCVFRTTVWYPPILYTFCVCLGLCWWGLLCRWPKLDRHVFFAMCKTTFWQHAHPPYSLWQPFSEAWSLHVEFALISWCGVWHWQVCLYMLQFALLLSGHPSYTSSPSFLRCLTLKGNHCSLAANGSSVRWKWWVCRFMVLIEREAYVISCSGDHTRCVITFLPGWKPLRTHLYVLGILQFTFLT